MQFAPLVTMRHCIRAFSSVSRASGKGTLFVVSTPLGNGLDITLRALQILKKADVIACEDTRRLLAMHNLNTNLTRLIPCHEHNVSKVAPKLLQRLQTGESCAMVSDAGTPGICDPGQLMVQLCHRSAVPVEVIPGPSAVTAAVAWSGLVHAGNEGFHFTGWVPRKGQDRTKYLAALRWEEGTIVSFERPTRLKATLQAIADTLKDAGVSRDVVIAREITKLHQELFRGSPEDAVQWTQQTSSSKGELVLLLSPLHSVDPSTPTTSAAKGGQLLSLHDALELVGELERRGVSTSQAVKRIADLLSCEAIVQGDVAAPLTKKNLYREVLKRKPS